MSFHCKDCKIDIAEEHVVGTDIDNEGDEQYVVCCPKCNKILRF